MKPITDEIVLSLIERAKKRQSAQRPANDANPLSAHVVDMARVEGGRIISLDFTRPVRRVRRTVSGVFCYAPRY